MEVDAADLLAGGEAVVVAHGQVVSPNLRVKKLRSTDSRGRLRIISSVWMRMDVLYVRARPSILYVSSYSDQYTS